MSGVSALKDNGLTIKLVVGKTMKQWSCENQLRAWLKGFRPSRHRDRLSSSKGY